MKWMVRLVAIPYFLLLCVSFWTWITVLGPDGFTIQCSVTNATNEALSITPVGTVGPQGRRSLLPMYRTSFPYCATSKRGDFRVAPNQTLRFAYDMDDINFSELVVEHPAGDIRQLVVNPSPTLSQYTAPTRRNYVISDFSTLAPVPAQVEQAAAAGKHQGQMWLVYLAAAILLLAECLRTYYVARRRKSEYAA